MLHKHGGWIEWYLAKPARVEGTFAITWPSIRRDLRPGLEKSLSNGVFALEEDCPVGRIGRVRNPEVRCLRPGMWPYAVALAFLTSVLKLGPFCAPPGIARSDSKRC